MFPIALDLTNLHIVLVGSGAALFKRLNQLTEVVVASLCVRP